MLTKADFETAIKNSIAKFPSLAPLFLAGDPRILQHLDAMATMCAMLSSQIEVAMTEPFEKARDATILADAALRGLVRKAIPSKIKIEVINKSIKTINIASGRKLFDSNGLPWVMTTDAFEIPPSGSVFVSAEQSEQIKSTHTVADSAPFYAIGVPEITDGGFLAGVSLSDNAGPYLYREKFTNVAPNERVFHIETDARQRTFIKLGFRGVVGYQPDDGSVLNITLLATHGHTQVEAGSQFVLDYIGNAQESLVEFKMDSLLMAGKNPPDTAVLRDLCKYPSVYDNSAVFLGEFDFLIRRNFIDLQFLSVWNELAEEQIRGAKFENINAIFVACLSKDGGEQTLENAAAPAEIKELTETQKEIKNKLLAADDSYKVRFFTPVIEEIKVKIDAFIPSTYVTAEVKEQITTALLSEYGASASKSRRGNNVPLYQNVYSLLKEKVPALQMGGADFIVKIEAQTSNAARPELWRYMSGKSLDIKVTTNPKTANTWG